MSELKSFESERIYWAVEQVERVAGYLDDLHLDYNTFYIKDDVDKVIAEKDKEIESLKKELSNLKSETKVIGTPKSIAEQICEALPLGAYIITVTPPMTSNPEDILKIIGKDVPFGTCLSICRWNKTYSIEFTKE